VKAKQMNEGSISCTGGKHFFPEISRKALHFIQDSVHWIQVFYLGAKAAGA
jgi:hypothetical protein